MAAVRSLRTMALGWLAVVCAGGAVSAAQLDPISPAELAARFSGAGAAAADPAAMTGDWTWIVAAFGPRSMIATRALQMPDGSLTALRFTGREVRVESYRPYWLRRLACSSVRAPFANEAASVGADGWFALPKTAGRGCWNDPGRFYCGSRVACDEGVAGLGGRCRLIARDRLVCRVTLDYDGFGAPLSGYMGFVRGLIEPGYPRDSRRLDSGG